MLKNNEFKIKKGGGSPYNKEQKHEKHAIFYILVYTSFKKNVLYHTIEDLIKYLNGEENNVIKINKEIFKSAPELKAGFKYIIRKGKKNPKKIYSTILQLFNNYNTFVITKNGVNNKTRIALIIENENSEILKILSQDRNFVIAEYGTLRALPLNLYLQYRDTLKLSKSTLNSKYFGYYLNLYKNNIVDNPFSKYMFEKLPNQKKIAFRFDKDLINKMLDQNIIFIKYLYVDIDSKVKNIDFNADLLIINSKATYKKKEYEKDKEKIKSFIEKFKLAQKNGWDVYNVDDKTIIKQYKTLKYEVHDDKIVYAKYERISYEKIISRLFYKYLKNKENLHYILSNIYNQTKFIDDIINKIINDKNIFVKLNEFIENFEYKLTADYKERADLIIEILKPYIIKYNIDLAKRLNWINKESLSGLIYELSKNDYNFQLLLTGSDRIRLKIEVNLFVSSNLRISNFNKLFNDNIYDILNLHSINKYFAEKIKIDRTRTGILNKSYVYSNFSHPVEKKKPVRLLYKSKTKVSEIFYKNIKDLILSTKKRKRSEEYNHENLNNNFYDLLQDSNINNYEKITTIDEYNLIRALDRAYNSFIKTGVIFYRLKEHYNLNYMTFEDAFEIVKQNEDIIEKLEEQRKSLYEKYNIPKTININDVDVNVDSLDLKNKITIVSLFIYNQLRKAEDNKFLRIIYPMISLSIYLRLPIKIASILLLQYVEENRYNDKADIFDEIYISIKYFNKDNFNPNGLYIFKFNKDVEFTKADKVILEIIKKKFKSKERLKIKISEMLKASKIDKYEKLKSALSYLKLYKEFITYYKLNKRKDEIEIIINLEKFKTILNLFSNANNFSANFIVEALLIIFKTNRVKNVLKLYAHIKQFLKSINLEIIETEKLLI